jgi:hypothetical protein
LYTWTTSGIYFDTLPNAIGCDSVITFNLSIYNSIPFSEDTITTAATDAQSVYAYDLDGDGDMDVLSASSGDDKIAWYENDGNQVFTPHTITTAANGAYSVYAADLDGDNDIDVLSASYNDDKIAWYENDGNQNFTAHTITTAANGARSVYAIDMDGDNDLDVLSASYNDNKIAWYENDGNQSFTPHTITTAANGARSVHAVDIDGDNDVDVLSASYSDNTIAWYENDGNQSFSIHVITTAANGASSVYADDLDGDGDLDVLSSSWNDNTIAWYENDSTQSFPVHVITTSADGAYSVYTADIDNDGDRDVLSASSLDDKIAWYGNEGSQVFTPYTITTTADYAMAVRAADVDGDGDMDVLSASIGDEKVAWYENGLINSASLSACDSMTSPSGLYSWTSSGNYTDTATNAGGCDSIIHIALTIYNSSAGADTLSACDSYTSPSGVYTWDSTGIYVDTIPNITGCDSIMSIDLTITNSTARTDTHITCGSFTWIDSVTYTTSNYSATDTLTNVGGCDSVISLHLTLNSNTGIDVQAACDSFIWIDSTTYTTSNYTATDTLTNVAGCDSVVTLNLTINNNTGIDTQTACDSLTWINGITYTSNNNTAKDTLTNVAGCDSVVTLDLTIYNSSSGTLTQIACDSYTSPSGMYTWTSSGTYNDTLTNAVGCDSSITINLAIVYSSASTATHSACDSFTWIDSITYTANNNTATDTLVNTAGCDSVITLNLTINNNTGTDTQIACDSLTWTNGTTYTTSNNTATDTLTNAAGCDSVVTLDLTINASNTGTDDQAACDSYTWIDGNTYIADNNSAVHTLSNMAGCDSVVTLDLTIDTLTTNLVAAGNALVAQPPGGSYQWLDCDNGYAAIAGETDQLYTPTSTGSYAAAVTLGACTDTTHCELVTVVGLEENKKSELRLYPNPTTGILTIEEAEGIASIYDVYGRNILTANSNRLDISHAADGIYFVHVLDRHGNMFLGKIVKE